MARYHIGVMLEQRGDLAGAAREYQRNLDDGVGEVSSMLRLAGIREGEGDKEEAEALRARARAFGETNGTEG